MASVVCDFLNAVYRLLLEIRDLSFPLIVNKNCPRKSIVRYIGTMLPLPNAPRVYFNLSAWHKYLDCQTPSDIVSLDENLPDDYLTHDSSSCDTCSHESTIKQLQEDLNELRLQVASILHNQKSVQLDVTCDLTVESAAPPPPPPPPPPPLLLLTTPTSTPVRPKRNSAQNKVEQQGAGNPLGEVLKEMKNGRPKLRPIERSPGGRPVKPPKVLLDPTDILTEVLKKRFIAVNFSDTNDSDCSSYTDVMSPDWNTCML